jgi:hypothetical protein
VIVLGSMSNSLRNRRVHFGYFGHVHASPCTMREHTRGFVLVRLMERGREVLAAMSSRREKLLINLAFVFNIFFVRHNIAVVSYCALASRRPLGNRATIIITLK